MRLAIDMALTLRLDMPFTVNRYADTCQMFTMNWLEKARNTAVIPADVMNGLTQGKKNLVSIHFSYGPFKRF